jgi:TP901-1 family phage major tail protein
MAGQKGRSVLIKAESSAGSGTYNTIGGLRATSAKINNEPVDITNKDSAGWRTLLEGAGVQSISVSGSGVFTDATAYQVVRTAVLANDHINFKIAFPGDTYARVYTGEFMITELEEAGEHNGEMTYSLTLESSGTIVAAGT